MTIPIAVLARRLQAPGLSASGAMKFVVTRIAPEFGKSVKRYVSSTDGAPLTKLKAETKRFASKQEAWDAVSRLDKPTKYTVEAVRN